MENGEPDFGRPSWILPAVVPPGGRALIRAGGGIVAWSHVGVYPNGCMLDANSGSPR